MERSSRINGRVVTTSTVDLADKTKNMKLTELYSGGVCETFSVRDDFLICLTLWGVTWSSGAFDCAALSGLAVSFNSSSQGVDPGTYRPPKSEP